MIKPLWHLYYHFLLVHKVKHQDIVEAFKEVRYEGSYYCSFCNYRVYFRTEELIREV